MQRVIASGFYTMGEEVREFEGLFAKEFGSKYAIMVNSGSSANLIMTAALFFTKTRSRLRPGDEVIVPAVSWSTTYYPLAQYGLRLRFVDIDLHTLNYDLSALVNSITANTRAIMVVNLLGNPNDFDVLRGLADEHDLVLLEDNCESMGATFGGRFAGTFGAVGSFSTFFSHHISTMEGGVVVTDEEELYHIMLSLRAHGWTRNLPARNLVTGEKSADPFIESYRFVLPGYNVRPLELSGAIGIEQLAKLPGLIEGRRKNGQILQSLLSDHPKLIIQRELGNSSWFGFSLVVRPESGASRAGLIKFLEHEGFEYRPIVAGNFTKNPVLEHLEHSIAAPLQNADYIDANGLFIGNHHYSCADALEILARF